MKSRSIYLSTITLIALLIPQITFAQGVNNPGSLPSNFQTGQPPTGWLVIDPNGTPIPVSLDPSPNAQPWTKNLTGPNGQPFSEPAFAPPLQISEILQVAPTLPWTDWHEEITTPGWVWQDPPLVLDNGNPITPTITGLGTNLLNFFFSPALNVGDVIDIRKDVQYQGIPGTVFTGNLTVNEFPTGTPEPASLVLLAAGSALLLKRRVGGLA